MLRQEAASTSGLMAFQLRSTILPFPGAASLNSMAKMSRSLVFLLQGQTSHLSQTSLGPLLTTLSVRLTRPLEWRSVPRCMSGSSWAKSMPSWLRERETGVPLMCMSMGIFLISWFLTLMRRLSRKRPLVSLNIVIRMRWLCFLFRVPEAGSQSTLMPLLFPRCTFCDRSSALFRTKVFPISELNAYSSTLINPFCDFLSNSLYFSSVLKFSAQTSYSVVSPESFSMMISTCLTWLISQLQKLSSSRGGQTTFSFSRRFLELFMEAAREDAESLTLWGRSSILTRTRLARVSSLRQQFMAMPRMVPVSCSSCCVNSDFPPSTALNWMRSARSIQRSGLALKSSKYFHCTRRSKSPVLMGSRMRSRRCVELALTMPLRGSILRSQWSKAGGSMSKAASWWLRLTSCSSLLRNLLELQMLPLQISRRWMLGRESYTRTSCTSASTRTAHRRPRRTSTSNPSSTDSSYSAFSTHSSSTVPSGGTVTQSTASSPVSGRQRLSLRLQLVSSSNSQKSQKSSWQKRCGLWTRNWTGVCCGLRKRSRRRLSVKVLQRPKQTSSSCSSTSGQVETPSREKTCEGALSKEARKQANLEEAVSSPRWNEMPITFSLLGSRMPSASRAAAATPSSSRTLSILKVRRTEERLTRVTFSVTGQFSKMGCTICRWRGKTSMLDCAGRVRRSTVRHWMASTPLMLRLVTLPGSDFSGRLKRQSCRRMSSGVFWEGVRVRWKGRSSLGFILPLGALMARAGDQKCQKQSTCTTARFLTFREALVGLPISVSRRQSVFCTRGSSNCSPSISSSTICALYAPPSRVTSISSWSPWWDLKRMASLKTPCCWGANSMASVVCVFFSKARSVGEREKKPRRRGAVPSAPTSEKRASPPLLRSTTSFLMTSPTQQCPQLTAVGQLISHRSLSATIGTRTVPSPATTTSSSSQSPRPGGRKRTAITTAIPGAMSPQSSRGQRISAIVKSLERRGATLMRWMYREVLTRRSSASQRWRGSQSLKRSSCGSGLKAEGRELLVSAVAQVMVWLRWRGLRAKVTLRFMRSAISWFSICCWMFSFGSLAERRMDDDFLVYPSI